ncbi:hypothetical protein EDEG_02582 [Edhazardia aedis USNM 41457]|uniref:Uncharacterized protein n=1 Tax=Edhazardia aedis (strain USNM 41457) TaxID=1003232 RepID=J9DNT1_EDHAE|nr:hypothetical protein EDEG_02582 [Edhazardia aedis USNM 41457]|eukprot:EJW03032.1 hypothetical protein EDEG_02582 [Edhazardia aedis USNM 41457]
MFITPKKTHSKKQIVVNKITTNNRNRLAIGQSVALASDRFTDTHLRTVASLSPINPSKSLFLLPIKRFPFEPLRFIMQEQGTRIPSIQRKSNKWITPAGTSLGVRVNRY